MKRKILDKFIFAIFKKAAKENPATRHGVFMFDEEKGRIVVDYPTECAAPIMLDESDLAKMSARAVDGTVKELVDMMVEAVAI